MKVFGNLRRRSEENFQTDVCFLRKLFLTVCLVPCKRLTVVRAPARQPRGAAEAVAGPPAVGKPGARPGPGSPGEASGAAGVVLVPGEQPVGGVPLQLQPGPQVAHGEVAEEAVGTRQQVLGPAARRDKDTEAV